MNIRAHGPLNIFREQADDATLWFGDVIYQVLPAVPVPGCALISYMAYSYCRY